MDVFCTWFHMVGVIITGLHQGIASKTVLESFDPFSLSNKIILKGIGYLLKFPNEDM